MISQEQAIAGILAAVARRDSFPDYLKEAAAALATAEPSQVVNDLIKDHLMTQYTVQIAAAMMTDFDLSEYELNNAEAWPHYLEEIQKVMQVASTAAVIADKMTEARSQVRSE